ncbi:MAG: hypothetical protein CM15mP49_00670 [Actinomycetota bacterium]|nr:MAG: hypothetical protein CM15mP49_00670 [Actinomycetota bacterium]
MKDAGYEVALPGNRGDVFAQDVTEMSTDFCGNLVKPSWNWSDINFNGDQNDLLYNAFWFGKQGNEPRIDGDEQQYKQQSSGLNKEPRINLGLCGFPC